MRPPVRSRVKPGSKRPGSGPNRAPVKRREFAPRALREAARPAAVRKTPSAPAGPLKPAQRRYLRGLAHELKAIILVGQKGVTPALLEEFAIALGHHELVKVRLADDDREARAASIESIRDSSGAEVVQSIGKVACFYKRNPDKAQFTLPR